MAITSSISFTVAPFWYWPPIIAAIMGVGAVEALAAVAPNRAPGSDADALGVLVLVLLVSAFFIISIRAERLEFTSGEVIYHQLWGVLRFRRSDISHVGVSQQVMFIGLVFVQLNSKKRPFIIPAYFGDYTNWMNMLGESSRFNKADPKVSSGHEV
jgi:hypothetical protein